MSQPLCAEAVRAIEHDCARLVARYANRNDAADWEAVAALYAPDGRMARPSAPDDWIVGREAILAAFAARPARTTRHVCSNVEITVLDADTALGESAMLLFTGDAAPRVGSFLDRFVRTGEGWRFAERRGTMTF
ncbi:nuclear transport factor 2 family protein [Novosphingobium sp. 1949]|uniref:Nuclear transport factor 2 family protein n=1 Tax=Novosphingobium organovorum TaxID=2930092 RepID=A0ABT0B9N3_9SPHN|nr:nuclear transport factor 2 family protein [Novosphingobium organovorum]MCJ2181780.1 nuclear transport factor 2 family protein [Novosphingobium organovorum]